ncbi:SDR family NAD(P)-dependent oxidoreductase [Nocardia sp. NPDC057272]|uniref:SDR family NAD(P)-dependent oxidoreductase n=1 Tax=Nocardia sp. NPDC057272 TaxID=3346079 RepID=UPI00363EF92F
MNPQGTSAIITGGASGLGLATARRLHADGAEVVLVDLPTSEGAARAAEIGAGAHFAAADIRDAQQVGAAVALAQTLAPLRVLVNCAGIGDPVRTVSRNGDPVDFERFTRVIDINLLGTFNVIRLAAAAMYANEPVEGERGVIVCTASVAAFDGQIGQASYSASKGALHSMTLPLAREFADALIRVNTIAPGMFATPILNGLSDEARTSLAGQVPHPKRLGDPDEYAALVEHLVSNPMINGETIRLDGAIRMAPR